MSRKYNSTERENWMKSIEPNYNNQIWHGDQVYHPTQIKHYKFFKRIKIYDEYINPKKIHGLEYAYAYNCPSCGDRIIDWKDMLHWLKRLDRVIDNFKTKEELIRHIHKNEDPKAVYKYGNHFFTISGQHRLCLAKYIELDQIKVNIHEYKLDKELFIREKNVEKHINTLKKYSFLRQDYINDIDLDFLLLNINNNSIFLKKRLIIALIEKIDSLKRKKSPFTFFWLSFKKSINFENTYDNSIEKKEDLHLLDLPIIEHFRNNNF